MRASSHPPHHALAGIVLPVAAVACFALLDTATEFITLGVPLLMALWDCGVWRSRGLACPARAQRHHPAH